MSDVLMIPIPFFILLANLIIVLFLEGINKLKWLVGPITVISGFLAVVATILTIGLDVKYIFPIDGSIWEISSSNGLLRIDDFSRFFSLIFLLVFLFIAASSIDYMNYERNIGVYYSLLILSTLGMMFLSSANDLLVLFVCWELGSLPAYSMVAYQKSRKDTSESSLKFFLYGAMSSAFIFFGISLVFGITGSTSLTAVTLAFSDVSAYSPFHILALGFLIPGFGYKIAAVPFHAWAVDVYEGAPTVVTAFLAAGSKAMGFTAIILLILVGLRDIGNEWSIAFAILAVITMTLGNVVALVQTNIKRMLAYSSIAHAGYILIPIAAFTSSANSQVTQGFTLAVFAVSAASIHILMHALMKVVAFIAVVVVANTYNSEKIDDYAGLRKRHPGVAFALTIALLSLMGVPPLAGFFSKLLIFFSAIYADLLWLAIIGIINSAISIFYYIKVIKLMFFDDLTENIQNTISVDSVFPTRVPWVYNIVLLVGTILIILLGIFPSQVIDFAISAAQSILG